MVGLLLLDTLLVLVTSLPKTFPRPRRCVSPETE